MDIISLTAGLFLSGYILNKDKKYPRNLNKDDSIKENEIPNGENIYYSKDFKKNTDKIQKSLNERYNESLDPNSFLVHPNSYYIKNSERSDPSLFFPLKTNNQSTNTAINPFQQENENTAIKPFQQENEDTAIKPFQQENEDSQYYFPEIPKKDPIQLKGITQQENNSQCFEFFNGETEIIHANMKPYYSGSQPKQPNYDLRDNVNDSFFKPPKREVESLFKPQKENIYNKTGNLKTIVENEKIVKNSLSGRQNNYNPFLEERQPPLLTSKIGQIGMEMIDYRNIPRMIEKLFVNPREVLKQDYSTPAFSSTKGNTIIPSNIKEKIRPNSYENQKNFTGLKSYLTKGITSKIETKEKEKVLNKNYFSTKTSQNYGMYKSFYNEKTPFKTSYTNDFEKNTESIIKDNSILFKDTYNPINNQRTNTKSNTYRTPIKNLIDKPILNIDKDIRKTIKETTVHQKSGNFNSYITKRIDTDNIATRTTQKENTISNDYFNIPQAPNVTPTKKNLGITKLNENRNKTQNQFGSRQLNITPRKLIIQDTQNYRENNRNKEQAISSFVQTKNNKYVPFFMVPEKQ